MNILDVPALLRGDSAASLLAHELIAMFEQLGFQRPGRLWPNIELADEPPRRLEPDRIDGLLGLYENHSQTVTLFLNPISEEARRSKARAAHVLATVLAHELAHWVTDRFNHPLSPPNPAACKAYGIGQPEGEGQAVTELVEAIAELATFAAINRLSQESLQNKFLKCFQDGHSVLGSDYRAFDLYFEFWPLDQVVGHLIRLARRNDANANRLEGTKDGLKSEYHWLGLAATGEGSYPWMLHREDGPAVVIPPDAPGQMSHDPRGWYRWPSKAVVRIAERADQLQESDRPAGMCLRSLSVDKGSLKQERAGADRLPLKYQQNGDPEQQRCWNNPGKGRLAPCTDTTVIPEPLQETILAL